MISWKNFDELDSYKTLEGLKDEVTLKEVMAGESGAERVKSYSVPMACGLKLQLRCKGS